MSGCFLSMQFVPGTATMGVSWLRCQPGTEFCHCNPRPGFPGGAKPGWWLNGGQLDPEAKRLILRAPASKPLRLRRTSSSIVAAEPAT